MVYEKIKEQEQKPDQKERVFYQTSIDFDPITGNLWDSENGPGHGDEINLVEPGFSSGWQEIQGFPSVIKEDGDAFERFDPKSLETFDGRGKYSDPEFSWVSTVGPTAIKFFDSDKFGELYHISCSSFFFSFLTLDSHFFCYLE